MMFFFDSVMQKIKDAEVQHNPWPHICIEQFFSESESTRIHKILKEKAPWQQESQAVRLSTDPQKEIDTIFDIFKKPIFLTEILKKFNLVLPSIHMSAWGHSWHQQGAKQSPHTDMHLLDNKDNKQYNSLFTQQIYFPDSGHNTNNIEDSGIWLIKEICDDTGCRFERTKQIKCKPGTYFCYPNSLDTYHEVPEQTENFDRISALSRTLLNYK